jgi:putative ABC transport system permease protein
MTNDQAPMTNARIIFASLSHHWRIHCAVALGVAAATAVLTGALVIGDSVRGSLKHLVLDRLGNIDRLLVVDRFFRQALAVELQRDRPNSQVAPAILFPAAMVQTESPEGKRLAAGVFVVGSDESFWRLEKENQRPKKTPGRGEIVVNSTLAEELNVKVGDTLVVRFGKADQVPADSPLGRRSGQIATLAELKLIEIIPAEGLGRFGLSPSQVSPRNAYVSLADVQTALDVEGRINALLVGNWPSPDRGDVRPLKEFKPRLTDYGLNLKHVELKFGEGDNAETIFDYFSLSSERLLIEPAAEQIVEKFAGLKAQPVLTYLANSIERVRGSGFRVQEGTEDRGQGTEDSRGIPYSTVTAISPAPGGPLVDEQGKPLAKLADDEIVLTSWAAEDQQAKVGERIRVTYFEPETTHGEERQASAYFTVKAIVPLTEPQRGYTRRSGPVYDQRPTTANDPDLTPEVKGITDQASIADWDPPFPFDEKRIRPQDDAYWENHRTTPKAYISLTAGQKLWGSRFGKVTSFRIPVVGNADIEAVEQRLLDAIKASGEELGFVFQPIKEEGLKAASGTTPFDVLFLLLSMFIIAAAIMLVWLLFRLGVEQRADEMGLLLALGWSRPAVRRLFTVEGGAIAALGATLGVVLGVGYAWLMIVALRTWWIGAIATPFLELYVGPLSLVIGFASGLIVCVLTIWFSLGRASKAVVRGLLAGEIIRSTQYSVLGTRQKRRPTRAAIAPWLSVIFFVNAVILVLYATQLGGMVQAECLLTAGGMLLAALLIFTALRLRTAGRHSTLLGGGVLGRLAFRNAGRNAGRSTATIALVACAAFLIVAVSAFRMSPTDEGVGGFDLIAESSQPIFENLNSEAGRQELLADKTDSLAGATVLSLRLKPGDDASCRNMYQPTQPRVLGVTPQFIEYFDDRTLAARFAWSASAAKSDKEKKNPWHLLADAPQAGEAVPVVLDQNTAMYSLRLYGGVGQIFEVTYAGGEAIKFRIVGLLANSVLQGNLLIGEADFKRLFPQISGYRFFLIRTPPGKAEQIAGVLEDRLGDEGFDTVDARSRLADLLAVQNTYISTFQSLGALGLVLGTFGLAAVQLRSVLERRKELALLRAAGFRRWRLAEMVLLENLVLLLGGLAIGTIAALIAVLPQMVFGAARPPIADLATMLGVVVIVGVATGLIAVRAMVKAPLVAALRGE